MLRALRWPLALAPLLALGHGWLEGTVGVMTALGLLMGWWVLATTAADLGARLLKSQACRAAWSAMLLAHAGVGSSSSASPLVSSQQQELDTRCARAVVSLGPVRLRSCKTRSVDGPQLPRRRGAAAARALVSRMRCCARKSASTRAAKCP